MTSVSSALRDFFFVLSSKKKKALDKLLYFITQCVEELSGLNFCNNAFPTDKPMWRQYAVTKAAAEKGQSAILKCDFRAYPRVNFEWSVKGSPIQPGSKYTISNEDFISTLTISNVGDSDFTSYDCKGANSEGLTVIHIPLESPSEYMSSRCNFMIGA